MGRDRADIFVELTGELATKADLKAELAVQDARLEEKIDHAFRRIIRWNVGTLLVGMGLVAGIVRFL